MSSNMLNETNSRLSNLPNEILDRVLSSIPTSALPKICLVSKSLRRAAEPFLYSDATSRWSDGMTPPMAPLLRTLLKKPKLFAFIETTPVRQFLEVIGQSREPYRNDDWILDLHTGQMSAIAATLISNLTRTTASLLTTISSVAMTLSSKFFDQTFLCQREMKCLRMLSLFYVLTVTHIVATTSCPKTFSWPRAEPNPDHLVSLDIRWPIEQFLAKILTRTRNLKSLSWNWIYCDNINEDPEMAFLRIMKSVLPVRGTLEALELRTVLSFNRIVESRELRVTVSGSSNGFRDSVQLTPLKYLPLASLAGVGTELRNGLKALNLFSASINDKKQRDRILEDRKEGNWNDTKVEMLQSLAAIRPTRSPALRPIEIISGNAYMNNLYLERLEDLVVGFQVQLTPYPRRIAE
ncbi:unnamed protein product [Clonostachys chloroleuca]|uniref:F-box domain-containing protein n=1 Tax=Clonostachys chloroleuca TaxID=1926264 RepID=A0AA35QB84_9HYPO|nr:unnamed protein product [Clonostachys chloroleuca]